MLPFAFFDHHNNSYVIRHGNHLTQLRVQTLAYYNSRSASKVARAQVPAVASGAGPNAALAGTAHRKCKLAACTTQP